MATHDYDIADQSGLSFLSDLNNALAAIVSNNSSPTEPADRFAYMWWADTTAGILKQRNAANTAWINKLTLAGTGLEVANNLSDVASAVTAFTNIKQNATTTTTGVVEEATLAELKAGTNGKYPDCETIRSNILGTVSQSAGVPTGAIIERGNNANGNYTKYADGTLICWLNTTINISDSATAAADFSFPVPFFSLLGVYATAGGANSSENDFGNYFITARNNLTTPSIRLRHISGTARTDTLSYAWLAIGRWF